MVVTADLIYRVLKNEFVEAKETEMGVKTNEDTKSVLSPCDTSKQVLVVRLIVEKGQFEAVYKRRCASTQSCLSGIGEWGHGKEGLAKFDVILEEGKGQGWSTKVMVERRDIIVRTRFCGLTANYSLLTCRISVRWPIYIINSVDKTKCTKGHEK